jgi:hypothetical protein
MTDRALFFRKINPGRYTHALGILMVFACWAFGTVTLTQGTIDYHHQDIRLNPNHTVASVGGNIVTTYTTLVLENEYLAIKIVPDYGGRVISMVYKPYLPHFFSMRWGERS